MRTKRLLKQAGELLSDFSADDALSLAAAVAFYTALSFAPLVLLLVSLGGLLGDRSKGELLDLFSSQLGPRAADVAQSVVEASDRADAPTHWWRSALSTIGLLVTASGVFGQLQAALNRVWDAPPLPKAPTAHRRRGSAFLGSVWRWLRKRLISMGMVLVVLFILLVSLVASALLGAVVPRAEGAEFTARAVEFVISLAVATLLFAAIFKFLPDTPVRWRQVWLGALVTSALFNVGKIALVLYIDKGGVGKEYGDAVGGLIALLVWVYYSCVALLLGAEITKRFAPARP